MNVYITVPTTPKPSTFQPTAMPTFANIPGYDLSKTFDTVGQFFYQVSSSQQLLVDACGASGGNGYLTTNVGGTGGCIQAVIEVTQGEYLTINVGGAGQNEFGNGVAKGGYSGGGTSNTKNINSYITTYRICIY